MKIVQVFKTDVQDQKDARRIVLFLHQNYAHCKVNFDLDDCDKVLRIESQQEPVKEAAIQLVVAVYGYDCKPLQD